MKKIYKYIINVERYFSQGRRPRCSVCRAKPRYVASDARQDPRSGQHQKQCFHPKNFQLCNFLSRPRVFDRLSASCQVDGSLSETSRYHGYYCSLYGPQSGSSSDSPLQRPQRHCDWQDEHPGGSGSLCRVCYRVCVSSQELSSVLLDKMKIKYLILGPGAMGYFSFLGLCSALSSKLYDVQEISGASAGAILALFIGSGMSMDKIIDVSFRTDLTELVKYNIKNVLNDFGFISHSQIKNILIDICEGDPKFKDLKKKIYISAYNVNLSRTEYFSVDTHPEMSVIDAVCMSISVPVMFCAVEHNGMHYVDGGTTEKIPAPPFLDKKFDEVLAVRLLYSSINVEKFTNVLDYLNCLMKSVLNNRTDYENMFNYIDIDLSDVNVFDFHMTEDDKIKLFIRGQKMLTTNNI